jgi:hypothetical protein
MGTVTIATTAPASAIGQNPTILILLLLLGSSVVAGILTHALSGLRASAAVRRDRYAEAVKLLAARLEYPYRIRRRTSDELETLAALAATGHDLPERLAEMRAWIAAEDQLLGEIFDYCLIQLDDSVKQACRDAWTSPPISTAAQMNLYDFGPGNQQHIITLMERAIAYRFGIRRWWPQKFVQKGLGLKRSVDGKLRVGVGCGVVEEHAGVLRGPHHHR